MRAFARLRRARAPGQVVANDMNRAERLPDLLRQLRTRPA
jgi:hypothetical protein